MTSASIDRRSFFRAVLLLAIAPLFAADAARADDQPAHKNTKEAVHYKIVMGPNNGKHCWNCVFFEPGAHGPMGPGMMGGNGPNAMGGGMMSGGMMNMVHGACKVVEGAVSPMGYCDLFAPKKS
ncbi:MAG: hypothetical protein M1336_00445 [Deltaproteobacteria bacterium]|nr:hypothetical protein [Deltaproteobacteria bacterium]